MFSPSICIISRFSSSSSLILCSLWSARFPILSNAFFILFTKFFSSRICLLFFRVSISLFKYFFSSLILSMSSLNCLSKFPCSLLNSVSYIAVFYDFKLDFWRTVIFFRWNSVSVVLYSTWNNCSTVALEVNDQVRSFRFICFPVGGNITQTFCFSYLSCLWLHLRVSISQFLPSL